MDDHSATGYYRLFQIGWYAIGIAILQREREYNILRTSFLFLFIRTNVHSDAKSNKKGRTAKARPLFI